MNDEEIKKLWEEYKGLLLSTKRENIGNLIKWLDENDFKEAPASTKFHHSFRGGLLKHSLEVYYNMKDFVLHTKFFDIPEDSIILMSLLHDICKVNCYVVDYRNTKNENGEWIKVPYYTFDELEPLGHADKSIMLIYEQGIQLTKLERACIRNHMGFSEQENTNRVSCLFDRCPQSLILYWSDLQSTYIQGNNALPERFREKLLKENITLSLEEWDNTHNYISIDGTKYRLAPENAEVDNKTIIEISMKTDTGELQKLKVYSPYGDGLPF